ncbi:hypothetical protein GCM10014715_34950 [Streptomyces spiralis]|uniref:Uncharacterized protein n=1 Tax=Streptomyces spiralis TaxID=66376 RepID=A0A918ZZW5_9ACTN|nr:hypothetical protein [Streptomyces spiralis]GHE76771.1 hypothetical protein GCM10014715_34950 [Streptomyces spiralis]
MGRVGRKAARVQVSSRLTWSFSARAGVGGSHSARLRPSRAASATQRLASAALVRSLLRAVRPRARARSPRALPGRRAGSARLGRGRDWR